MNGQRARELRQAPAEPPPSPAERLQAAREQFEHINRLLPAGIQGFSLPPEAIMQQVAGINALCTMLIAKGILDEQEFVDAKTSAMAEIVEEMVGQARELKRQATGLVIAAPGQRV